MSDIKIDYEAVSSVIGELRSELANSQGDLNSAYDRAISSIEEYSGKEAEALRQLQNAERQLMRELSSFLLNFANSIQFVTNELANMDGTGAVHMSSQPRGYQR